jgi:hypothetical protein
VRDSLRSLLARPIGTGDRTRLAALGVAVLAAVLVAMQLVRSDVTVAPPDPRSARSPEVMAPAATPTPDPALAPLPAEGEEADPPPRARIAEAKRAARAFLRAYLPYSLGRGDAAGIPYASDDLRTALAEHVPRLPETLHGEPLRTAVELMQVEAATDQRVTLLVMARAAGVRTSVELHLARYASGWIVFGVEG